MAFRGVAFVNAFRAHVWGQRGTPKPCPRDAKLSSAACVLAPRRAKKRIDYRSRAEGELPSTSDQRYDRPPSSTAYLAHRTADARPATSEHKAAQSTPACSLTRPTGEQPHLTSGSQSITQRILRTICHDPLPPNLGSKNDPQFHQQRHRPMDERCDPRGTTKTDLGTCREALHHEPA